jgi:uncharacterized membrane protein
VIVRRLTLAAGALALAGAAIAGYLTWVHYAELEPFCVGGGAACERVQNSRYADLAGVPVAVLGLAGYLAILGSLTLPGAAGRSATAFVALVGAGFSLYLTYVEVAVIEAICQWCVASAVVMTMLACVTVARMVAADMNLSSPRT